MKYILDANILTRFQDAGQLAALCRAASSVPLLIVEEVYDELTLQRPGDKAEILRKKRAAQNILDASAKSFLVRGIVPDSPAHHMLLALRSGRTSERDIGEAASVALACEDPSLVFVCGDKNATLSALNELHSAGERVLRPHVFLRRLLESGALHPDEALACSECFGNYGIKPSWWARWLGGLLPAR